MTRVPSAPARVDISKPAPARIYDYMLRGSNHFQSDIEAAERILSAVPEIRDCAWSNRGFHQRAAKWIAEQGVRQFIDIGSGLPTVGNTHEVVQKVIPGSRVVYIDSDPMVAEQGGQLLAEDRSTRVICADLREPDTILDHPDLRELIDFSQPTGLLLTAVMMFVSDAWEPWDLVARYIDGLAPGSYLALSHLTDDHKPPQATERFRAVFDRATEQMHFRSKQEIARFFGGLQMVPPHEGAPPALSYTGSGVPRTRCSRTAKARAGSTAAWPGSKDRQPHDCGPRLPPQPDSRASRTPRPPSERGYGKPDVGVRDSHASCQTVNYPFSWKAAHERGSPGTGWR